MKRTLRMIAKALLPEATLTLLRVRRALRGSTDPEARLLPLLARDGAFLDVGANMGSWSGPAARVFRMVHAFEPNAGLAAALRTAAPPNVMVHEVALSDREGVGRFAVPVYGGQPLNSRASLEPNANSGFGNEVICQVKLTRLDSLGLRDIDAIKIDVEGHESAVLEGGRTTIERERPTLIVEIEERHHAGQSEGIIGALMAQQYLCCFLRDKLLEQFRPGTIDRLQANDLVPVPGERAGQYVNNFIFIPRERPQEVDAIQRYVAGHGR